MRVPSCDAVAHGVAKKRGGTKTSLLLLKRSHLAHIAIPTDYLDTPLVPITFHSSNAPSFIVRESEGGVDGHA